MISKKYLIPVCVVITILTLTITFLFMNGEKLGLEKVNNQSNIIEDDDWDISNAQTINLSDLSSLPTNGGAVLNDGNLMIISSGDYLLTGSLDNGQILIDGNKEDQVHLFLDNASINSGDQAAIEVNKASSVIITTKDGSESKFSSSLNGENADVDGVIYSKADMAINGKGTLNIEADNCHGLVCNDSLSLLDTNFNINSGMDAIHVNDSVEITGNTLNLQAADDAITIKNDDNTGQFLMNSGTIKVTSCQEGIEANHIQIDDGSVDITMIDDGINATGDSPVIDVNGGNINITCQNGRDSDGLDSNGSINLNGGNIFINIGGQGLNSAIDVATETGGSCQINGATVIALAGESQETSLSSETQGIITTQANGNNNSTLSLKSQDSTILDKTIPYSFTNVIISSPELKDSESYSLDINGSTSQVEAVSEVSSGMMGRGMMGGRAFNMDNSTQESQAPEGFKSQDSSSSQESQVPDNSSQPTPPSQNSSQQTPPELPSDFNGEEPPQIPVGEMPELPEGSENGEMPQPPEFNGSDNQMTPDGSNGDNFENRMTPPDNNMVNSNSEENRGLTLLNYALIGGSVLILIVAFRISFLVKGKYL